MRDEHQCQTPLGLKVEQVPQELCLHARVERARGLVRNEDGGIRDEGSCERKTLEGASVERRAALREKGVVIGETGFAHHAPDALDDLRLRKLGAAEFERLGHDFEKRHPRARHKLRILFDPARALCERKPVGGYAVEEDFARVGCDGTREERAERALARTALAHDDERLARHDGKRDVREHFDAAEVLCEAPCLDSGGDAALQAAHQSVSDGLELGMDSEAFVVRLRTAGREAAAAADGVCGTFMGVRGIACCMDVNASCGRLALHAGEFAKPEGVGPRSGKPTGGGMPWTAVKRRLRHALDGFAEIEDVRFVGKVFKGGEVVRDEENAATLVPEASHLRKQKAPEAGILPCGGFVEDHVLRVRRKHHGPGGPAPLTAAQGFGPFAPGVFGKTTAPENGAGGLERFTCVKALVQDERFGGLSAHAHEGMEGRARVLRKKTDACAADAAHGGVVRNGERQVVERHFARDAGFGRKNPASASAAVLFPEPDSPATAVMRPGVTPRSKAPERASTT